jgi:hypothetical protein
MGGKKERKKVRRRKPKKTCPLKKRRKYGGFAWTLPFRGERMRGCGVGRGGGIKSTQTQWQTQKKMDEN